MLKAVGGSPTGDGKLRQSKLPPAASVTVLENWRPTVTFEDEWPIGRLWQADLSEKGCADGQESPEEEWQCFEDLPLPEV